MEKAREEPSLSRVLIALFGIAFFIMNAWLFGQQYLLKRFGISIQANVTGSNKVRRKGGIAYNVDYAFVNPFGRHWEGSGQVTDKTYYNLRPDSRIEVRYIPFIPSISETAEMSHNSASMTLSGGIGIPVSLFMIVLAFRKEASPPERWRRLQEFRAMKERSDSQES